MITAFQAAEISNKKNYSGIDGKKQLNEMLGEIESLATTGKSAMVCYFVTQENVAVLQALGFNVIRELHKIDGIHKYTIIW